jgi:hypothetical protein
MKNLSQDNRSPSRNMNLGSPEYEVGALNTQTPRSVPLVVCPRKAIDRSVSTVSDYGLEDRAIGVGSLAEAKGYFIQSLCPDRFCGPSRLLSNGYRGSSHLLLFSRDKARSGCETDHSPPSSAEVKNEKELHFLSPKAPPLRVVELLYVQNCLLGYTAV